VREFGRIPSIEELNGAARESEESLGGKQVT
jgi:hypothetical protein